MLKNIRETIQEGLCVVDFMDEYVCFGATGKIIINGYTDFQKNPYIFLDM